MGLDVKQSRLPGKTDFSLSLEFNNDDVTKPLGAQRLKNIWNVC